MRSEIKEVQIDEEAGEEVEEAIKEHLETRGNSSAKERTTHVRDEAVS